MSKVAGKQKRIDSIVSMLEKGMERKDILQTLAKSCKASARTLDSELKEAKLIVSRRNEQKEEIRQSVVSEEYKDVVKGQIVSDLELEAILCKIATGNMQVEEFIKGVPILRDVAPSEQIQAIDKLYKKRGTYSPIKTELDNIVSIKVVRE